MRLSHINPVAFVAACVLAFLTGVAQLAIANSIETGGAVVNTPNTSTSPPPPRLPRFRTGLTAPGDIQDNLASIVSKGDDHIFPAPEAEVLQPQPPTASLQEVERQLPFNLSERLPTFLQPNLSNTSSTAPNLSMSFRFSSKQPWTPVKVDQMDPSRVDFAEYISEPHQFDLEHPVKEGNHTWIFAMFEPGRFALDFTNLMGPDGYQGYSRKEFRAPAIAVLHVEFVKDGVAVFAGDFGDTPKLLRFTPFESMPDFTGAYPVIYQLTPRSTNTKTRLLWGEKVNSSFTSAQLHPPKLGRYFLSSLRSVMHDQTVAKPSAKVGVSFSHGFDLIANNKPSMRTGMDIMSVRFTSSLSKLRSEEQRLASRSMRSVRALFSTPQGVMAFASPASISVWHHTKLFTS